MLNFNKMSKVILIAGALAFAFISSHPVYAETINDDPLQTVTQEELSQAKANMGNPDLAKLEEQQRKLVNEWSSAKESDLKIISEAEKAIAAAGTDVEALAQAQKLKQEAQARVDAVDAKYRSQAQENNKQIAAQKKTAEKAATALQKENDKQAAAAAKAAKKAEEELAKQEKAETKALEKTVKSAQKEADKAAKNLTKAEENFANGKITAQELAAARSAAQAAESKKLTAEQDLSLHNDAYSYTPPVAKTPEEQAAAAKAAQAEADARTAAVGKALLNEALGGAKVEEEESGASATGTLYDANGNKIGNFETEAGYETLRTNLKNTYNDARNDYNRTQAKLSAAKADCALQGSSSEACKQVAALEEELAAKKTAADTAYKNYQTQLQGVSELSQSVTAAKDELNSAQTQANDLQSQLNAAVAACEYSKGLTSKAGQADAQKYCAQAESLQEQYAAAQEKVIEAENKLATQRREQASWGISEHDGQVYSAYEKASELGGTPQNIFNQLTRRAFIFLLTIKPIIYVLAGFGLIGFAFMAIFNKISWKWFSHIAIGLFLVANMGRLIEYIVFPGGDGNISVRDLSYGDYLSQGLADADYKWVEPSVSYQPPANEGGDASTPSSDAKTSDEAEIAKRKFCGKTENATGWANFSTCVKDIVSAGRKAVDAAKTAKQTVVQVKSGINNVKNAAQGIGDAVKNSQGKGLSGIIQAAGQIGGNINNMVGTAGGIVNGVMSNAGNIANDVQDISKSTEEVAELDAKRAKGEGTNKINQILSGQVVGEDGQVERLVRTDANGKILLDGEGNVIQGETARDKNVFTTIEDTTAEILEKNKQIKNQVQDITKVGYEGAKLAEDALGVTGKLSQKRQQKAEREAAAKAQEQAAANQERLQQAAAEQQKKDEEAAAEKWRQEQAAAANATIVDKAKQDNTAAEKAAAQAKQAEQQAQQKAREAERVAQQLQSKQEIYKSALDNAQKATVKAQTTGTEADKRAAEQAARRAEIAKADVETTRKQHEYAQAAANEAKTAAAEAQKPVTVLSEQAQTSAIAAAEEVRKQAEAEAKQAALAIVEAQKAATAKAAALKAAEEAAAKAKAEALAKDDIASITAARQAQTQAEAARKALQEAEDKALAEQKRKQEADLRAAKAVQYKIQAEAVKNAGVTTETVKEIDRQSAQAEQLRQQYLQNNTPDKAAEAALQLARQAEAKAEAARQRAEGKRREAELAKAQAKTAADKAAKTGKAVDLRYAEQLKKRAELASSDASTAEAAAKEAAVPVANLKEAARQAGIAGAAYQQQEAQIAAKTAQAALTKAREGARVAAEQARLSRIEANRKIEEAAKYKDDVSILAARQADETARRMEQQAREAQKQIDAKTKNYNEAQMRYYEAGTAKAKYQTGADS